MRRLLVVAAIALAACTPTENAPGASVVWLSSDNQNRVIQMGPCFKTQVYDSYTEGWETTATQCSAPSGSPR